ncbi:MAG TPA: CBS domain-containing protein [Gemmatimonadaceae bacterium]|nr:CBS domain-containing protein [Gemmatimonadaceae bacterium]
MLMLQDIMTRDVFTVSPDLPLADLLELLSSRHIGGAPVVSGETVIGVVSATDLLSFAATVTQKRTDGGTSALPDGWAEDAEVEVFDDEDPSSAYFTHLWNDSPETPEVDWEEVAADGRSALHEYTAADVMSRDVKSLPPNTEVAAAAEFMKASGIHRVLVMTDSRLDGIVSTMDIVDAVAKHQILAPQLVYSREREFEADWSHEPIVPDVNGRE